MRKASIWVIAIIFVFAFAFAFTSDSLVQEARAALHCDCTYSCAGGTGIAKGDWDPIYQICRPCDGEVIPCCVCDLS